MNAESEKQPFASEAPEWLAEFEKKKGRPLRVLHYGNIANNAYINAKIMRRIGVHADVVCADYYHGMSTPEWEEAGKNEGFGDIFFPDWWRLNGDYRRPDWFFQGPASLCRAALISQFDKRHDEKRSRFLMQLAQEYISFRDSSLGKRGGGLGLLQRLSRRWEFLLHLIKMAAGEPGFAKNALMMHFPILRSGVAALGLVMILPMGILAYAARLMDRMKWRLGLRRRGRILNDQYTVRILRFRSDVRAALLAIFVQPSLNLGARLFRMLFGRNFSDVTGKSAVDVFPSVAKLNRLARARTLDALMSRRVNVSDLGISEEDFSEEGDLAAIANALKDYAAKIRQYKAWGVDHVAYHQTISEKDLNLDFAIANGMADGWREVFRHYDIIQCYSTDGIIPMALGSSEYFCYEHGTLRQIPFDETPVGRLTATAYRRCRAAFVTNLDNLESCRRLKMAPAQIVALPHATDDSKILNFQKAHMHLRPRETGPAEFFSSARQHWIDRDPSMAKGNDIFLRALANVVKGGVKANLTLVEWGRDLDESKKLIDELGLCDTVTWVPTMSGEELWKRYLVSHAVVDQFVIPAFGRVTFDALLLGRRVITNVDRRAAAEFFTEVPPILTTASVEEAEVAIRMVTDDVADKAGVGQRSAAWAKKFHSTNRILQLQLDAYKGMIDPYSEIIQKN